MRVSDIAAGSVFPGPDRESYMMTGDLCVVNLHTGAECHASTLDFDVDPEEVYQTDED